MIQSGREVEHPEYGSGKVLDMLGNIAQVDFFGESLDVPVTELRLLDKYDPTVSSEPASYDAEAIGFRKAFEAMNLGVIPPDPSQLIGLTIGSQKFTTEVKCWLKNAPTEGLCKAFFGFYGAGKSHHLQLIKAISLKKGWVTAFLEFDPKSADPAKPHLVYQGLMNGLTFPKRENRSCTEGFFGLVKEIRNSWDRIRDGRYFRRSPWFSRALDVLHYFPHSEEDKEYVSGVGWLAGQVSHVTAIRKLASRAGLRGSDIPIMPRVKETGDIYVFHLVVLNEICKALGYSGLVLILDEAEHVRGYNVRRKERANNFFDILARSAHQPSKNDFPPVSNDHVIELPAYWKEGSHFGLFVGLTEGDTFADPLLSLRDACVFLHREDDRVILSPPTPEDYQLWCEEFFTACYRQLGARMEFLTTEGSRRTIAATLRYEFEKLDANERVLRVWIKLASLVPSILMCRAANTQEELIELITSSARKASGYDLPWE